MIILIMGVSGSGKTTLGKDLAVRLGLPFYDADSFHTSQNIEKMNRGIALTDEDRLLWLQRLASKMKQWEEAGGATVACSALRDKYRTLLQEESGAGILFVYIKGSPAIIHERLTRRTGHFFNPILLDSQFLTLEEPAGAIVVDAGLTTQQQCETVMRSEYLARWYVSRKTD
ncbi:MAG: gluconokinase [Candidatus Loosdrechtia sp.]|uniref:gluconokinase n=1 Tax=Candidatus Loosdrechtia sp. TaxID=3101272 RepID=UPI003A772190|nr:MAG: gluconokinase [Candidatus Jettenia sp. AMX2]